jgi:hypothetical protein
MIGFPSPLKNEGKGCLAFWINMSVCELLYNYSAANIKIQLDMFV